MWHPNSQEILKKRLSSQKKLFFKDDSQIKKNDKNDSQNFTDDFIEVKISFLYICETIFFFEKYNIFNRKKKLLSG